MTAGPAPLYVVLNRSGDEFGEYQRFLDGTPCRMVYLTTPGGLAPLRKSEAVEIRVLDSLAHEDVLPVVRELVGRHGTPDAVFGQSEYDILTAALLSDGLGVRGGHGLDLVRRFKDKPTMKSAVRGAGLRVPDFCPLDRSGSSGGSGGSGGGLRAEAVIEALGSLPLILKPRASAGSEGVTLVESTEQLEQALSGVDPAAYECEEYIEGAVFHVDGVYRSHSFHFVTASRYVNTCLDYAHGRPLGSVLLGEGRERAELTEFAERCLRALGLTDGAFHLELIRRPDGELVFLEVGLRPGGAQVPFLHADLFGIDLFAEAFRAAIGLPPLWQPGAGPQGATGGWLIYPTPGRLPSRVTRRTSLRATVPEVYHEELPPVGWTITSPGGYDNGCGTFRFRGDDPAGVLDAVHTVLDRYDLRTELVDASGTAPGASLGTAP
ncbi:acetyl-CoA carboxylase biotin carboxylase subunit family protein [Streptomyces sp. A 4/2]|uniref:ATP-grasp domain-containing protein n=1 Tax=Streptomyces sp. A 4/2 TaxID=2934314 RepID=UPI0020247535|nr:ATP-grasp domain-containing protein [Streptomyces sp. A 4/2]